MATMGQLDDLRRRFELAVAQELGLKLSEVVSGSVRYTGNPSGGSVRWESRRDVSAESMLRIWAAAGMNTGQPVKDPVVPSLLPSGSRVRATLSGTAARGWFVKNGDVWQMLEAPGGYYHSAALTDVELSEKQNPPFSRVLREGGSPAPGSVAAYERALDAMEPFETETGE